MDDDLVFLHEHEEYVYSIENNLVTFYEEINGSNSHKWMKTMGEEIQSTKDNDIWDLFHCQKV